MTDAGIVISDTNKSPYRYLMEVILLSTRGLGYKVLLRCGPKKISVTPRLSRYLQRLPGCT